MLSYVLTDLDKISQIYEGLPPGDVEVVADAIEEGEGVRLFQDGSLQIEETGKLILDGDDVDLMDDGDFRREAEQAGGELEGEVDDDSRLGCLCHLS